MWKWLKERLDQFAIDLACRAVPPANPRPNQLGEAREILETPGFFNPPEIPAQPLFQDGNSFTFKSALELPWPEANLVSGMLFRAEPRWADKPLLLLAHGWNAGLQYRYQFPLLARYLNGRGVNVAMLRLPFHGSRRPRTPGAVHDFISDDIPVMLRASAQAIADFHSFLLWARQSGCPATGLWGFSLSAWLAGLHACLSDTQDIAVLTTPISDMEWAISSLPFCKPIRHALGGESLALLPLNLSSHRPQIPAEHILITQSEHDLFVSSLSLDQLRHAWPGVKFWTVPHGHISVLLSWKTLRRTCTWCVEKLLG